MAMILIVDDDSDILESFKAQAEEGQHQFIYAISAMMALDILTYNEMDLVVTDYKMPGVNGFQFIQSLKMTYPKMKVLLYSGYADALDKQIEGLANKPDSVLSKPATHKELTEAIESLL